MQSDFRPERSDLIQSRLLALAGLFLFLYSLCLTLAGAVLERSVTNGFRWNHWLGWGAWVVDIYRRFKTLAVGYTLISVLLAILGSLSLFAGIILHSMRALLLDIVRPHAE